MPEPDDSGEEPDENAPVDDPKECLHDGGCPFRGTLAVEAPHIIDLFWFTVSCLTEDEVETELSRQLREQQGEGSGAVQKERKFGLSIERFWHFWKLKSQRFGIPDAYSDEAWQLCALVRQACEDAQAGKRADVWERRRREKRAKEAAALAAGEPLPESPFEIAKRARAEKAARRAARAEAEEKLRQAGAPLPEKLATPPEE